MCVLPPQHPLCQRAVLTPQDFHGENYVSLSRSDSYRQLLDALFHEQQVERRLVLETHSAASVCAMVRAGVGISIVNPLTALDYADSGVVMRRFSIAVPFTVSLVRPQHRPASALVDLLRPPAAAGGHLSAAHRPAAGLSAHRLALTARFAEGQQTNH